MSFIAFFYFNLHFISTHNLWSILFQLFIYFLFQLFFFFSVNLTSIDQI